jgi:hypothetical protein
MNIQSLKTINFSLTTPLSLKTKAKEMCSKVYQVFKIFLNIVKGIVSFPIRYLGSKTWSLPGLIIKIPFSLFKNQPFFDKKSYHYGTQKKLTAIELKPYLKYAATSAASFKNDPKWLEGLNINFHCFSLNEIDLKNIPGKIIIQNAVLFDPDSGLKVLVAENENEVIVSFGARDSLSTEIDIKCQKQIKDDQFNTAALNLLGANSAIYEQASAVITALQKSEKLKNKQWVLVGQSFGGGLAQYVGIKKQIRTVCFNSIALGAGLQKNLGDSLLAQSDEFITHISAENDILSDFPFINVIDRFFSLIGIRTPGNFGQRFSIPSAYSSIKGTHNYILGSIMKHLGYTTRCLPQEAMINVKQT